MTPTEPKAFFPMTLDNRQDSCYNGKNRKETESMTIKELRAKTGMTQTEFGKWLGIPMRTIQNWENGQRAAPQYVVDLIAFRIEHTPIKQTKKDSQ